MFNWRRIVLVTAVLAAVAAGTAWAEQSNGAPELDTRAAAKTVKVGQAVDVRLDAADPDQDPLRFSVTGGALPNGLTLDPASGEITGVVIAPQGRFPVAVTVEDGRGGRTVAEFAMTVAAPGAAADNG